MVQRRAARTVALIALATLPLGFLATQTLGFNADPNALFSPDLRFQQMIQVFSRYFPVLTNSLLIVIDGTSSETTREAQEELLAALAPQTDVFDRVFLPGEDPFFERAALLYASVDELEEFADGIARVQPMLGELSRDPSLSTLARMIQIGLEETDAIADGQENWVAVLDHFSSATVTAFDEYPVSISWESVLLTGSGFDPTPLRVIVADPILDLERILAAEAPIAAVRRTVEELGLGPERGLRVRITGYPAINHEEMIGLASDTSLAGFLSFVLVVIVLSHAFRSARMVIAAAITLLTSLVWAAAFAGVTVGDLNPVSIAFSVLVIGLGVDFMIHYGMHFAQAAESGEALEPALLSSVRKTGTALVLCATTTCAGFLAFIPTEFRGVSDLGVLATGGILAIFFNTLTLFPALLRLLLPPLALERLIREDGGRHFALPAASRPRVIVAIAVALGTGALVLAPRVDLDTNVIRMRNPSTESVQAFEDLLDSRVTTPWYLDALTPSLAEADRLADRIRELAQVDRVVTLSDFVPEDQADKLEILMDLSLFLDLPLAPPAEKLSSDEQTEALRKLESFLSDGLPAPDSGPLVASVEKLADALAEFLERVDAGDDDALARLEVILVDPLPKQLDRLRASLDVGEIARADLPSGLVSRMLADDGHARIQVYPAKDVADHAEMVEFVEAVRPITSEITGLPVNLVESARASWESLREALLWAAAAIAVLLMALWRSPSDTVITIAPLLLAVLLTMVSTLLLPVSFNFANLLVLPLLLGIGIDGSVHLVQRSRHSDPHEPLLASTTARAVLYSAITTIASFGTLVVSQHNGIASLGVLLVVGMLWVPAANLVLLPALLDLRARRGRR